VTESAPPAKRWALTVLALLLLGFAAALLVALRGSRTAPPAPNTDPSSSEALARSAAAECDRLHVSGEPRPADWQPPRRAKFESSFMAWESKPPRLPKRPPAALSDPLPDNVLADLCRVRAGMLVEDADELLSWLLPRLTPGLSREQVLAYLGSRHEQAPRSYRADDQRTTEAYFLRHDRELRLVFEADGKLSLASRTFGRDPRNWKE
jgi:hypothetical protein